MNATTHDITTATVEVTVGSRDGLHARPAARVVAFARELNPPAMIARPGGPQLNPKSLAMLLAGDFNYGDHVVVHSVGEGSQASAEALAALIAEELDRPSNDGGLA
ncbi:HPr family phosphocarrier protein [Humidisolicoccus flavus]|uniref:HPr family phosphocarrier protein n=1 Tax=Humidisolicoccus flavus TaxID=3111414 RepID=UPI00324E7A0A